MSAKQRKKDTAIQESMENLENQLDSHEQGVTVRALFKTLARLGGLIGYDSVIRIDAGHNSIFVEILTQEIPREKETTPDVN